ncbi:MAG: hypothetical protein AYK22_04440 [Thermoplasmatales archaeon SG8-52-3]|nr:MAG: hypothetical protein AYK22_04440 [Thermoplasmatales archaeon SG8-52-3]
MKNKLFVIGLCAIIISMPSIIAFPSTDKPLFNFSPLEMADGTFVGGLGRGHWGNGFHIDLVNAYMNGEYTTGAYTRITGDITNPNNKKIGEISVFVISIILFGYTKNTQGQRTPIIAYLVENRDNQFVGQVLFSAFKSSPHIWGYLIPNA